MKVRPSICVFSLIAILCLLTKIIFIDMKVLVHVLGDYATTDLVVL